MNRKGVVALSLGVMSWLVASCAQSSNEIGSVSQSVVDGSTTTAGLGFEISALEKMSVLGQLAVIQGQQYQGCSGTLVGDRVVITAGHCIIMNQQEWFNGEQPSVTPASYLRYAAGDDVNNPDCLFRVLSVHLHPDIHITPLGTIANDITIAILRTSALEYCPAAMPLVANREPLSDDLEDELLLQGGFGSTDGSYDFSPIRYWSLVRVNEVDDTHVWVVPDNYGFPTFGDSGSGILRRFPDGSLRHLGISSIGVVTEMGFIRTDDHLSFFDDVVDPTYICGPVGPEGICRDDTLITCTSSTTGFRSTDCTENNESCVVDGGVAGCVCLCNQRLFCESTCACDPDCPCTCDQTSECDEGCVCDPDCYECGAIDEHGVCDNGVLITCNSTSGFDRSNCGAQNEECVVDDQGKAACAPPQAGCTVDAVGQRTCPPQEEEDSGCSAVSIPRARSLLLFMKRR